jgi:spore coat polysaccharide biosynthesis protein SpsF
MGSTRLPGKILLPVHNKLLLEHILFRIKRLQHPATVVIATSTGPKDDVVEAFCQKNNVPCFRGSEQDVLARYYECAKKYEFDNVVRLTADNPFPDIEELDNLLSLHLEGHDYSHSFENLPIGVGSEVFTFKALEQSYLKGKEPHHREHVNEYMLENPSLFNTAILDVSKAKKRHDVRMTVDTPEDMRRASFVVANATSDYVTTEEGIRLCTQFV